MTDSWWGLTPSDRRDAIAYGSARLGQPAHVLEKDIWVVTVLSHIFGSVFAPTLTFKGGTSLSKVFGIIDRFSEDIDVTVNILDMLAGDIPHDQPIPPTRNKVKRVRKLLGERLPEWVDHELIPVLGEGLVATGQPTTVGRLDGSVDTVIVEYEPTFRGTGYLLPQVKLEFGARSTGEPRQTHQVVTTMSAALPQVMFPHATVCVMAPERTFWEKVTALHVFCAQDRPIAERFSRHWSDVAAMWHSGHALVAIANRALASEVAQFKAAFYPAKDRNGNAVDYRGAVSGDILLVPSDKHLVELGSDFQAMVDDGLLGRNHPPFEDIVATVKKVEDAVNSPGKTLLR